MNNSEMCWLSNTLRRMNELGDQIYRRPGVVDNDRKVLGAISELLEQISKSGRVFSNKLLELRR
jgi:hypothetical protein